MAGHSKWNNIKNRKAKGDAARAKVFTKIGREIAVAVKTGGADPENNSKLKDIVAKARAANMPNENILRGIKKASGELGSVNYEEIVYEGYGAGGVAVIVECLTDNKNRTAGDVRHIFDKYGGSLGSTNCVSFMFEKKGVIIIEKTPDLSEETVMEHALECGAEDFVSDGEEYEIYTAPQDFSATRQKLEDLGYSFLNAETDYIPANTAQITGDNIVKFNKMLDAFEDLDDVQNVFHNAEYEDENQ